MKVLLWLIVAVLILMVRNVITFEQSQKEVTVHFYTQVLERDARKVVTAGRQLLDRAEQILDSSRSDQPSRNRAANRIPAKT